MPWSTDDYMRDNYTPTIQSDPVLTNSHETRSYRALNPLNAELLGTLASPPLNSWEGGGVKKTEYSVMLDLYEDTNRILAYEQIIT